MWDEQADSANAFVQATKSAIGRLRPDFLDRCKPAQFVQGNYAFQLEIGHFVEPDCTETNKALLEDGRSSFPSGIALFHALQPLRISSQRQSRTAMPCHAPRSRGCVAAVTAGGVTILIALLAVNMLHAGMQGHASMSAVPFSDSFRHSSVLRSWFGLCCVCTCRPRQHVSRAVHIRCRLLPVDNLPSPSP